MRVLLFGPPRLADFLRGAGHEVFELHANDLAARAAQAFGPEAVLYFDRAEGAVVPHEEALKVLVTGGFRVVLAAPRQSPLVPFAGALGVRDFVFLPAGPEEILHRLENPATPQEAAEALRGLALDPAARAGDGGGQGEGEPGGFFRRLAGGFGSRWRRTQREPPGEGEKAAPAAAAVRDAGGPPVAPEAVPAPAPVPDEAAREPLTGCYTRRCLEILSLEPPCAVVFIDLDGFKEVNDTLGHDAGDRVLAAFGEMLRENLKGKDVPIRWGGDEFVLVLPGTAGADAERVVEGLRRAWRENAPDTRRLKVDFSAGVAEWRGGQLEAAIKEADRLMYAEKKSRKARRKWEEVRGREEGPYCPAAWKTERARSAGVPEAVRQGFSFAAYAVLALGLVSGCIWLADLAARLFGVHAPVLREAAKVVEGFWGLVLAGVRG